MEKFLKNRWLTHGLYWAGIYGFSAAIEYSSPGKNWSFGQFSLQYLFNNLLSILVYIYPVLWVLIPRYLYRRKVGLFILLMAGWVIVGSFLSHIVFALYDYVWNPLLFGITPVEPFTVAYFRNFIFDNSFFSNNLSLTFLGGIRIFNDWYRQQQRQQMLMAEKRQTERQLLKTQLQPQFLTTTLDSVAHLTAQQPGQASQVVLTLANLLSYLLYDSQHETVSLDKEIDMARNYTFLTQTHSNDKTAFSFTVQGLSENRQIVPLILLPFLQNALNPTTKSRRPKRKTRQADKMTDLLWARIDLTIAGERLTLKTMKSTESADIPDFTVARQQLHSHYPNRYQLTVTPKTDLLLVQLELAL